MIDSLFCYYESIDSIFLSCRCVPGDLWQQGMDNIVHLSILPHPHAWHMAGLKNMLGRLTKMKTEITFLVQNLLVVTRKTAISALAL